MSESAAGQLRRILHLVPRLADGEEHPVEEIAAILDVDRRTLLADIASLVERFDVPGGFVEGVQLCLDANTVSATTPHFLRPMRLTMRELCALELGLSMLRAERTPEELPAIERALARLRAVITKLPQNDLQEGLRHAELGGSGASSGERELLRTIRTAIASRHKVELRYRAGGARRSTERMVAPYSLLFASGMWYVVALCEGADGDSDGLRFFRADRIERVVPTKEKFELPSDFSVEEVVARGKAFSAEGATTMTVRYSPRIARWIAEREGASSAIATDGSLTMEHPVADVEWALRHVLQYGAEAEVVAPREIRQALLERLERMSRG